MDFTNKFKNMIRIDLAGADFSEFLDIAYKRSLYIYHLKKKDNFSAEFWINSENFAILKDICDKRGYKIEKIYHAGIYAVFKPIFQRRFLLGGCIFLLIMLSLIPTRILFVSIQGNSNLSRQQILSSAEACGIEFGASRKNVRSEKAKNALLSQLPELQWAGVNTNGCVAQITVKERTGDLENRTSVTSAIVADRDGQITSCVLEKGNLLCTEGQVVQKGQLLISGFTDYGAAILSTVAVGEVFAKTERHISVIIPTDRYYKGVHEGANKNISILIGKKRINLWKDSGICDVTCDRMYAEYYLMLPGGYQIPLGISVDICSNFQYDADVADVESTKSAAINFSKEYLRQQMIAGTFNKSETFFQESDNTIYMTGYYDCTEMIGRAMTEQNGEEYVKND